jgi:hypothetical protein
VNRAARRVLLALVADDLRDELRRVPGLDAARLAALAGLVDDLLELAGMGTDQPDADGDDPFDVIYREAAG